MPSPFNLCMYKYRNSKILLILRNFTIICFSVTFIINAYHIIYVIKKVVFNFFKTSVVLEVDYSQNLSITYSILNAFFCFLHYYYYINLLCQISYSCICNFFVKKGMLLIIFSRSYDKSVCKMI